MTTPLQRRVLQQLIEFCPDLQVYVAENDVLIAHYTPFATAIFPDGTRITERIDP